MGLPPSEQPLQGKFEKKWKVGRRSLSTTAHRTAIVRLGLRLVLLTCFLRSAGHEKPSWACDTFDHASPACGVHAAVSHELAAARRHQDREHSPDEMTAFCDYRKVLHDEGRQTVENAAEVKDELARLREIFVGR